MSNMQKTVNFRMPTQGLIFLLSLCETQACFIKGMSFNNRPPFPPLISHPLPFYSSSSALILSLWPSFKGEPSTSPPPLSVPALPFGSKITEFRQRLFPQEANLNISSHSHSWPLGLGSFTFSGVPSSWPDCGPLLFHSINLKALFQTDFIYRLLEGMTFK